MRGHRYSEYSGTGPTDIRGRAREYRSPAPAAATGQSQEQLPENTILTPHPGEMSRLTGGANGDDRIGLAAASARSWRCVVVLKGAYTVVARPDGRACLLPFANPALATAGTGDVLAGAIL